MLKQVIAERLLEMTFPFFAGVSQHRSYSATDRFSHLKNRYAIQNKCMIFNFKQCGYPVLNKSADYSNMEGSIHLIP